MKNKGLITDIKRFAVHDGYGIRTTVFFKGCPLNCLWCQNPESIDSAKILAYFKHKCINCSACVTLCPNNAHSIKNGEHFLNRDKCISCGLCVDSCFNEALIYYGREITAEELFSILLEDKDFYKYSDGGITLSGGECLMQADFCAEILKKCKLESINTAVDTCGFVPQKALDKVIPYTDTFLYDIKAIDEDIHIKCTGKSNKIILENLKYLCEKGKSIEVRIPFVPDFNSTEIVKIANFLKDFKEIRKIKLLPYHNFSASKYEALSIKNTLPDILPDDREIKKAEEIISNILNV